MRKVIALLVLISILFAGCVGAKSTFDGKSTQNIDEDIEKIEKALEKETVQSADEGASVVAEGSSTKESVEEAVGREESTSTGGESPNTESAESKDEYFKVLEVNETQLVKLNVNIDDESEVKVTYSKPLDSNGEWQTNYGDAGKYEVVVSINDGEYEVNKKVLLVVNKVNRPPRVLDITLD